MTIRASATTKRLRRCLLAAFAALALTLTGCADEGSTVVVHGDPVAKPVVEVAAEEFDDSFALPEVGSPFATSLVDELVVREAPVASAEEVTRLERFSHYGLQRTVLVLDHHHDGDIDWLEILLPMRPNGTTGWIAADDVVVDATTVEVHVHLEDRRIEVVDNGRQVLDELVVVGHPSTPTPVGTFYVTDPIDLTSNPHPAYGVYAIGLSGYSEVLESFAGGKPQIAIHGTRRPDLVGQAVSNGCIRVPDDVALQIADLVDLGTPVHIHA